MQNIFLGKKLDNKSKNRVDISQKIRYHGGIDNKGKPVEKQGRKAIGSKA